MQPEFPYDIYGFSVLDPKDLPSETILKQFPREHQIGIYDTGKPARRPLNRTSQVNSFDPSQFGSPRPRVIDDSIDPVKSQNIAVARPAVQPAVPPPRQVVAAPPPPQQPQSQPQPQTHRPMQPKAGPQPPQQGIKKVDPATVHSDDPFLCLDGEEE